MFKNHLPPAIHDQSEAVSKFRVCILLRILPTRLKEDGSSDDRKNRKSVFVNLDSLPFFQFPPLTVAHILSPSNRDSAKQDAGEELIVLSPELYKHFCLLFRP